MSANRLAELQAENNARTRGGWQSFAEHRSKTTALLAGAAPRPGARLCVVGAGNCNDLDLAELARAYAEVHLVDLDAAALEAGAARQGAANVARHGGIDATGMIDAIERWSPAAPPSRGDLLACAREPATSVAPRIGGPFDVVASTCISSQLMDCIARTLGADQPAFVDAMRAVRAGHVALLAALAAPGGVVILVSDFVSSESYPALGQVPEADLTRVLAELVRAGKIIHGVNPATLAQAMRDERALAQVTPLPPWRWTMGPRVYGVCAIAARKVSAAASG